MHGVEIDLADHEHVDVVRRTAGLAEVARGPGAEEHDGLGAGEVGERLGDDGGRPVGAEDELADGRVERMTLVGSHQARWAGLA